MCSQEFNRASVKPDAPHLVGLRGLLSCLTTAPGETPAHLEQSKVELHVVPTQGE
jgi:hypothetical protein